MGVYEKHVKGNQKVLDVVYWWRNHRATVISIVSAGMLAVLGAWRFDPFPLWLGLFVVAVLGAIVREFVAWRDDRDFNTVESDYEEVLRFQEVTRDALTQLLQDLGKRICHELDIDDEKTRITFYGHRPGEFVPLARYSSNPDIQQIGREFYPDDQGIISFTWREGRKRFSAARKNREERIKLHSSTGIPREVIENFNMIPRCILGLRLDPNLGVVIIESENQLKDDHLTTLADTKLLSPVLPVLRTLKPVFSDIAKAR